MPNNNNTKEDHNTGASNEKPYQKSQKQSLIKVPN